MVNTYLGWTVVPLETLRAVLQHISGAKGIPWKDITTKTFYGDNRYLQIEVGGHDDKNYLAHCYAITEGDTKKWLLGVILQKECGVRTKECGIDTEKHFECLLINNVVQPREIRKEDFMKKIQEAEKVAV